MSTQDKEIDSLVDIITAKVRARLGHDSHVLPGSDELRHVPCEDDTLPENSCGDCGLCVVRRPGSVRAIEQAGAQRVAAPAGTGQLPADIAKMIDHTLLRPDCGRDDVTELCQEARKYKFASVCVNTTWVPLAKSLLHESGVMVCAVVGFPLGAMTPMAKAFEAREAVRQGASEIDMVINLGALKSGDFETVLEDISGVVKAARPAHVKVILETGALTDEEKVIACTLAKLGCAHFVKTSTGFGKGGATVEDVALMRKVVGPNMGVKASGGVRTREDVENMARAGATRIGASASIAIVTGEKKRASGGY